MLAHAHQQAHGKRGLKSKMGTNVPEAVRCAASSESSALLNPSGSPSRACARAHTCAPACMSVAALAASALGQQKTLHASGYLNINLLPSSHHRFPDM